MITSLTTAVGLIVRSLYRPREGYAVLAASPKSRELLFWLFILGAIGSLSAFIFDVLQGKTAVQDGELHRDAIALKGTFGYFVETVLFILLNFVLAAIEYLIWTIIFNFKNRRREVLLCVALSFGLWFIFDPLFSSILRLADFQSQFTDIWAYCAILVLHALITATIYSSALEISYLQALWRVAASLGMIILLATTICVAALITMFGSNAFTSIVFDVVAR